MFGGPSGHPMLYSQTLHISKIHAIMFKLVTIDHDTQTNIHTQYCSYGVKLTLRYQLKQPNYILIKLQATLH